MSSTTTIDFEAELTKEEFKFLTELITKNTRYAHLKHFTLLAIRALLEQEKGEKRE